MTEPIMQRLGFVRVHGNELRTMRRRRLIERVMVLAAFVGVVSVGVYAHGLSSRARSVSEMSIPKAFDEISNRPTAMGETLRYVGEFLSPPEGTSDELTHSMKPTGQLAEHQSRVPWSDYLFD